MIWLRNLRCVERWVPIWALAFNAASAWMPSLNALSMVTYDIDQKHGTKHNKRFLDYLKYVQEEDPVCCGAMTDAKADRNLRPSQQPDPDQYLHVVEEKDEGIIVRGAKLHQTGAINSHETIVMPTRAMREDDDTYAISFALPADAEGIIYIYGTVLRHPKDRRRDHRYRQHPVWGTGVHGGLRGRVRALGPGVHV